MTQGVKRSLSITAIVIASVSAGMIISADLGLSPRSSAQQTQAIQTPQGPVASVTIPSFADVAARVMPSVVSISTESIVREQRRGPGGVDPFEFFFPDPRRQQGPQRPGEDDEERRAVSGGSGFIISADGYIMTNNHVIEGASKVTVHYGDDVTAEAKIIGRDPATDLALIKIDRNNLPAVRMGDSDRIRVGDWALAIGNPLQFENTLTVGVISAKGRSLGISRATRSFENFIQTDAAINFGNSGGPLLNINGEVIGINTAIRGGAQNIGFATPSNVAQKILPQLRKSGKVTRGYLGLSVGELSDDLRSSLELPAGTAGILVQEPVEGAAGDKAGIRHDDVLTQVDGRPIRKTRDLIDYISDQTPGTDVKITLIRNGRSQTVTARVGERPAESEDEENAEGAGPTPQPARNKLGLTVQEINAATRQTFGIPENLRGLIITDVKDVSPAGETNLLTTGDVIREVNGRPVSGVAEFKSAVDAARSGAFLRLYVTRFARGGRSQSFSVPIRVP